jgi:hypothetical protein
MQLYQVATEPIPGDTLELCGNLVSNHCFVDSNQAGRFMIHNIYYLFTQSAIHNSKRKTIIKNYTSDTNFVTKCIAAELSLHDQECYLSSIIIQQNQRQVELIPCYLTLSIFSQSRLSQWSVNISTAKVISTACCGIVYLLGMLFMWLNFIQVQSANIISMLHLDNVQGDWINIAGRRARNPLQRF